MTRRTLGAGLTAALLLLVSVSAPSASASTLTVTQAIKAQDKIVHANPEYKELQTFKVNTLAEAKKAIPKLQALAKVIDTAAGAVAGATATSSQKTGQKDWVDGARLSAKGIDGVAVELADLIKGNKTAAKAAYTTAEKTTKSGDTLGSKGDRLLGLPTTD